jgi:phage head maturation protease
MIIAGSIAIGQLSTGIVPATGTRERLLPGVFDDSLKRNRITATINHDHARPIGFTLDGSLTVRTTATALHAELLVDDGDENHRQLVEAVHAGQCVGMSFLMSRVDGGQLRYC